MRELDWGGGADAGWQIQSNNPEEIMTAPENAVETTEETPAETTPETKEEAKVEAAPEAEAKEAEAKEAEAKEAAPKQPAPEPSQEDVISELERLGALRDQGILTEEEFEAQKAKLLAG